VIYPGVVWQLSCIGGHRYLVNLQKIQAAGEMAFHRRWALVARQNKKRATVFGTWKTENLCMQLTTLLAGKYTKLGCGVGTSDLDAQISGIQFWKDDEKLRPVSKNWVVAYILDF
jgi:hypothetical protein